VFKILGQFRAGCPWCCLSMPWIPLGYIFVAVLPIKFSHLPFQLIINSFFVCNYGRLMTQLLNYRIVWLTMLKSHLEPGVSQSTIWNIGSSFRVSFGWGKHSKFGENKVPSTSNKKTAGGRTIETRDKIKAEFISLLS